MRPADGNRKSGRPKRVESEGRVGPERERCSHQVRMRTSMPRWRRCRNAATVFGDGGPWCRAHCPTRMAERRREKYDRETAAMARRLSVKIELARRKQREETP